MNPCLALTDLSIDELTISPLCFLGDGTFSFEEFVQVMANMGGISEQSEEDEEKELREAFKVSCWPNAGITSLLLLHYDGISFYAVTK